MKGFVGIGMVLALIVLGGSGLDARAEELSNVRPAAEPETQTHSSEELQMIAERMSSLTGGLGRMAAPPNMDAEIQLPLDGRQPQTNGASGKAADAGKPKKGKVNRDEKES